MENAVHALLIVAGVLIGVMILSLGVSLFSSLSGFVEEAQQKMEMQELQQFNEQFLKYINCDNVHEDAKFTLTIQDIITAANTAYQNNKKYGLEERVGNNYYVTINIRTGLSNVERVINNNSAELSDLLENSFELNYKCSNNDIRIDPETGRVFEVNFSKITE